ncbi:PD-(D/E)XK nuclease family protein [uncultured Brachyspira sp.]|uniref:PD-(D/E)XK nuclease family protein n=1 Tax=uncultured Brachyspira sp. TaxID=221953 RepID=UPI00258CFDA2|nr:PD-(D/E)XK nuclease family protein [uncultured Brachyspira sp.]
MNDKIFSPNPKDLIKVIDNLYSSMNNYNIEVINLISNLEKENIKRYEDILKKQDKKLDFNIFDIITDKWKKENFHSEILKFLLENYEVFFNNFLELINIKDEKEYLNAEITNEEARIDILIKSEKKAIIVENKINWAKDMPEQLFRYYNECKYSKGLEVDRIVYLSPNSSKEPADDSVKEIPKELIKTIVGFDGSENDLVSCLEKSRDKLKENLEKTKNNLDSEDFNKLFFINHYIEILKRTGVGDMSEVELNFFKEIMEKYKTDKDIFKKINYIAEMCSNNNLAKILNDYFISKLGMNNCGYNKEEGSYSCQYWLDYNKDKKENAFSITIHSYKISKVHLTLWDNNENINNILKTVIKKEAEYLIKEGLTDAGIIFNIPDEEDKLLDLVIKLKNAFDEFCNS